jgi:hypothetical protein
VYGGGFDPLVLRWNFRRARRLARYAEVVGGAVITTSNVPLGDTSAFNFVAKVILGGQIRIAERQSLDLGVGYWHLSNAFLSSYNPSLNGFHLSLGYHWYKPDKMRQRRTP